MSYEEQLKALEEQSGVSNKAVDEIIERIPTAVSNANEEVMAGKIESIKNIGQEEIDAFKHDILELGKNTVEAATALKETNKPLNGEYDNEKELRDDVMGALAVARVSGFCREWAEGYDNTISSAEQTFNESIKQYSINVETQTVRSLIEANEHDCERASLIGNKKYRTGKKVGLIMLAAFAALFVLSIVLAVMESGGAGSLIAFCVIGIIAAIIVTVNQSKKIAAYPKYKYPDFNGTDELRTWYNAALAYFDGKRGEVEAILDKEFEKMPVVIEFRNGIAAYREYRKSIDKEFNDMLAQLDVLCADFINMLPDKFKDCHRMGDLYQVLDEKRADSLKEAYPILETRYREEARDEENRRFHEQQNALAQDAADEARRQAEYAQQQAQYAERQMEYQRQAAVSAAAAAASAAATAAAANRSASANEAAAKAAQKTAEEAERKRKIAEEAARKLQN